MLVILLNFNILISSKESIVILIEDRNKYFFNLFFKDRVKVSYELMDKDDIINVLLNYVIDNSYKNKKILIEFIKKESVYNFYRKVKEFIDMNDSINCSVEFMIGDDNFIER